MNCNKLILIVTDKFFNLLPYSGHLDQQKHNACQVTGNWCWFFKTNHLTYTWNIIRDIKIFLDDVLSSSKTITMGDAVYTDRRLSESTFSTGCTSR